MKKIVLASNSKGKLKELQATLAPLNIEIISQSEFNTPDVEETGLTFIENAIIKARHAAHHSGLPALADDSGLEVDALQGAPGIYSARFAGEPSDDTRNNEKLLQLLTNTPDGQRTARFQCVLALMRHADDPTPTISQGTWEGRILRESRGSNGFGYDPLFFAFDAQCCSAELSSEQKNKISHRGKAVTKLLEMLQAQQRF